VAEKGAIAQSLFQHVWPLIEQSGREKLLRQAARNRLISAERRCVQLQRQDLCAYYIETLCRLTQSNRSQIGEENYEKLKEEFFAAKAAWLKVRGKSKRSRPSLAARSKTAR
jgi:hypothetical protein